MNNGNDASKKHEESDWGSYARGAVYALQSRKNCLVQVGGYADMPSLTFFTAHTFLRSKIIVSWPMIAFYYLF